MPVFSYTFKPTQLNWKCGKEGGWVVERLLNWVSKIDTTMVEARSFCSKLLLCKQTCGDADADRDGKICKEERKEFALYLRLLKNTNVPDVDNIATCGDADAGGDAKICKEEWKEFALYPILLKNKNVPDVDNIAVSFQALRMIGYQLFPELVEHLQADVGSHCIVTRHDTATVTKSALNFGIRIKTITERILGAIIS
nr:hypothetical protein [Tanacetum cinerariifolium]